MKSFEGKGSSSGTWSTSSTPLIVTIIGDKRCTSCVTQEIEDSLKRIPFLSSAQFIEKDFSDDGTSDYLKKNSIALLPAFIFSTNKMDDEGALQESLAKLPNGEFSLAVGSKFDPFAKRSDKGFLVLDKSKLEALKKDSYIDGNEKAKITWIEYSDIECPYCQKLHNSGTIEALKAKYGDNLNRVFQNFPLSFHKDALPAAQILECLGKEAGAKTYYDFLQKAYKSEKSDTNSLLGFAQELGVDTGKIEVCTDANTYLPKIQKEIDTGKELFGIEATPGSVLINNETGEYEIVSGALPTETFEKVIDKLLK